MRPRLIVPPKLQPGDRVAVLSPSFAAPGAFPAVHELAMRRLREELRLEPVEYPTTRQLGAPAQARAADITWTRSCWPRTPRPSAATATTPTC
jgi:hypothetical protein